MSEISALDKGSVHRICSGQVVLTLGICVKELLENALDAGASRVEVGFMESGLDVITVSDDGHGVGPQNYPGLALKHHTSKIRDFNDVACVDTFGFRGEALSSLCALSNLSVITRTADAKIGVELTYDHSGTLVSTKSIPRDRGTTIVLKELFYTLPVRRAELKKHVKREFGKMLNVISSYALISSNLRLFCWNNVKGKRTTVLQTHGRGEVRDALKDVFGSKSLKDLHEINEDNGNIQIKGFISSVKHGEGRNAPDRQFLYLNHRPADLNKIRRCVNEVYKTYNRHQYPFLFLNVDTDKSKVDINVTPDKRQIFIENEAIIIEFIQKTLGSLYEDTPSTFDVTPLNESIFDKFEVSYESSQGFKRSLDSSSIEESPKKTKICNEEKIINVSSSECIESPLKSTQKESTSFKKTQSTKIKPVIAKRNESNQDQKVLTFLQKHLSSPSRVPEKNVFTRDNNLFTESKDPKSFIKSEKTIKTSDDNACEKKLSTTPIKSIKVESLGVSPVYVTDVGSVDKSKRRVITVTFDMNKLSSRGDSSSSQSQEGTFRQFFAKICPEENNSAEDELKKSIKKESFREMTILGQFNLGFIICQLKTDLFIVDQHATDEKYNFENLSRNCRLEPQNMVIPQALDLNYVNEALISENIDIFKDNGFEFEENVDAVVGGRFKLKRVPMYRNWSFGKSDVEELLFMLRDYDPSSSGVALRPSRVKAMFASRACRSSVMIGTALSPRDMRSLIDHMADMDHPWNCPHGRPTMRHLISLNLLK